MESGLRRPIEQILPREQRDRLRAAVLANAPRGYSPALHLALPSAFSLAVIAVCLAALREPSPWVWLTVPITWLATNANEWRIHRDLLHRRSRIAPVLYDRHTPEHHVIYVTDDMAIRDPREFHLVLIPAYGLLLIFATVLPLALALAWLASPNLALLYVATAMAYATSYEWLHLSYHLREDGPIGRLALVRRLRRHHAIHHDPRLMQRWNFNVTIPLWDLVMGTIVRDRDEALALEAARPREGPRGSSGRASARL
jgi:sterol desaturase/sphingolipid hydroxylase (fatty acid hydroxylase superfamily)